jgi:predicted outer membrane repeat protein
LQQKIDNSGDNSTIIFANNYTYDDEFTANGILINKSLTIDGKGYTINANHQARIFNIAAANVTLKNINFINGNASYGGAICWNNTENGIITDCLFEDNEAYDGGAIYFKGSNGIIKESNFTDNEAYYNGAVYMCSLQGSVIGCIFANNIATDSAGALGWVKRDNGTVINSQFINNSAPHGGAIYLNRGSNFFIGASVFEDNTASEDGGAIFWDNGNEGRIEGSSFTNNIAAQFGGAIYFNGTGNVINCEFYENYADYGGAIYICSDVNVTDCKFIENSAEYGGAIWGGNNTLITNGRFNKNNAVCGQQFIQIMTYSLNIVNSTKTMQTMVEQSSLIWLQM